MDAMNSAELDRREIADLLKVKVEQVNNWLVSNESRNHEEIPDMAIELLTLKLQMQQEK